MSSNDAPTGFSRQEFDNLFPDRYHAGSRFTITGREAAKLWVTIQDGWAPDECHVCGEVEAYEQCEACHLPVCPECLRSDEEALHFCRTCWDEMMKEQQEDFHTRPGGD